MVGKPSLRHLGRSTYVSGYGRKPAWSWRGRRWWWVCLCIGRSERPSYKDEPPLRPSYGDVPPRRPSNGRSKEESYERPKYERRDDDEDEGERHKYGYGEEGEEGYGRKKHGDDDIDEKCRSKHHHHHHRKSCDDE